MVMDWEGGEGQVRGDALGFEFALFDSDVLIVSKIYKVVR